MDEQDARHRKSELEIIGEGEKEKLDESFHTREFFEETYLSEGLSLLFLNAALVVAGGIMKTYNVSPNIYMPIVYTSLLFGVPGFFLVYTPRRR